MDERLKHIEEECLMLRKRLEDEFRRADKLCNMLAELDAKYREALRDRNEMHVELIRIRNEEKNKK